MLLAAAALMGCSAETETVPESQASRQPISFSATGATSTRTAPGTLTTTGAGTGEVSLRTAGFGVFASHTGLHPYVGSDITPDYMWNQRVDWNATDEVWDYTPLVYWPNTIEGLQPYVSFFAYAPFAENPGTDDTAADRCIVDMSRSMESGDPWLVYQLGGSEDDWQSHQVDLLYDFRPDQQQGEATERVNFQFRHALAQAGDQITVASSPELQWQLMQACSGTPVSLTLDQVELVYTLLRKGRLWLSSTDQPRWETVTSESPTVRRRLILGPALGHVLCTATSASACTVTDFTATDQGIFYIPLTVEGIAQRVDIRVYYHIGDNPGALTTRIDLTSVAEAGGLRNFRIVLPKI